MEKNIYKEILDISRKYEHYAKWTTTTRFINLFGFMFLLFSNWHRYDESIAYVRLAVCAFLLISFTFHLRMSHKMEECAEELIKNDVSDALLNRVTSGGHIIDETHVEDLMKR